MKQLTLSGSHQRYPPSLPPLAARASSCEGRLPHPTCVSQKPERANIPSLNPGCRKGHVRRTRQTTHLATSPPIMMPYSLTTQALLFVAMEMKWSRRPESTFCTTVQKCALWRYARAPHHPFRQSSFTYPLLSTTHSLLPTGSGFHLSVRAALSVFNLQRACS